jgi:O-6-methylguanine DNA methyltransferase
MNAPASSWLDLVTTWGLIRVAAVGGRLVSCELPPPPAPPAGVPRITGRRLTGTPENQRVLRAAEKFIRACLQGRPPPAAPPLALPFFPALTVRVLAELQTIPRGATVTYGELARRVDVPRAARAVGTACSANPLPLFVPCHRVVAAHGALGGFSAGLAWKKFLLAKERAR